MNKGEFVSKQYILQATVNKQHSGRNIIFLKYQIKTKLQKVRLHIFSLDRVPCRDKKPTLIS